MQTTLNKIREHGPCQDGWKKLLSNLGKTQADYEILHLRTILDSNGLTDTLWCLRAVDGYDREIRLFVVWCARQVQHLMTDQRSLDALDVAQRYAEGKATVEELATARYAASGAAYAAASVAANTATARYTDSGAWNVAWSVANTATNVANTATRYAYGYAVSGYDREKQKQEFLRLLDCIDNNIKYEI